VLPPELWLSPERDNRTEASGVRFLRPQLGNSMKSTDVKIITKRTNGGTGVRISNEFV
jgi:hypothetical protein